MNAMVTYFVRSGHEVIEGDGEAAFMIREGDRLRAFIVALLLHGLLALGFGLALSAANRVPVALFSDGAISLAIDVAGAPDAVSDGAPPVHVKTPFPPPSEERNVPDQASLPEVERVALSEPVLLPSLNVPAANSDVRVDPLSLIPLAPVPFPSGERATGSKPVVGGSVSLSGSPAESAGPQGTRDQPTALSGITPRYPFHARAEGQEGTVVVRVRVSREGRTESAEVVGSSCFSALDEAALGAVRKARFAPAERGGRRVAGEIDLTFEFRLEN
jgi:protein TonB